MINTKTILLRHKQQGFTLIELMVAMVIGLIILLGLVSIFTSSSALNRAQSGLSVLQENGRYAILRIKQDIENAGRKHCATVALPTGFVTDWNQGYEMASWTVDSSIEFTNGLPSVTDVSLDSNVENDNNQLGDTDPVTVNGGTAPTFYPLDPSYFIRGHECSDSECTPELTTIGADASTEFRDVGIIAGSRSANTDIFTVRYLTGGTPVSAINGNQVTLMTPAPDDSTGDAIVADCNTTVITPATWGANNITTANALPSLSVESDTRVFNLNNDFKTVSYFVGVDEDPNDASKVVSSLYRSENGNSQQLVEGVERMDVFYLAQLQTGHVARLTADQVQAVVGGGDVSNDGMIDEIEGCIIPPSASTSSAHRLANDQGCLWRSIYAIEVHLLLNTVNDSSLLTDDPFNYSPDGLEPQNPSEGLVTQLAPGRMYRKEFTAIVPVRSYTL